MLGNGHFLLFKNVKKTFLTEQFLLNIGTLIDNFPILLVLLHRLRKLERRFKFP